MRFWQSLDDQNPTEVGTPNLGPLWSRGDDVLPSEDEHRLASCLMKTSGTKICVPICVRRSAELSAGIAKAAKVAELIELRLDCLDDHELETAMESLPGFIDTPMNKMILTMRPSLQGGHTSADYQTRRRFWSSLEQTPRSYLLDLELDLVLDFAASEPRAGFDWIQVICSHHDFTGTPVDLGEIYDCMSATPARILKIAVQATDAIDCLQVFRLLERAQREGREIIAISMGQAGIMTRILGPSRGSFLTYASLDDESGTASGQLNARELREVYRIDQIGRQTEIFGIIGKPVGHSVSPQIHNAAFAAAQTNAVYIPFEVSDVVQFIRRMAQPRSRELDWNLRGLSVTAPHKSVVMNQLDWIAPAAKEIGAVNTILVKEGSLHGYNTDAPGFVSPLLRKFGSLKAARCAIIGAGGGARAALWALRNQGAHVALCGRDLNKSGALAKEFGIGHQPLLAARFDEFDLVINATPLGTRGEREDDTPATADQLRGVRLAYDLVYNPLETRFLREARAAGCETLGGIEMLLAQAVEQFRLWTGSEPDVEVMRTAALRGLGIGQ